MGFCRTLLTVIWDIGGAHVMVHTDAVELRCALWDCFRTLGMGMLGLSNESCAARLF